MTILSYGVGGTHVGKVRTNNEDYSHIDDELGLYVVADGMGGAASGEVASRSAVEAFVAAVSGRWSDIEAVRCGTGEAKVLGSLLQEAVSTANRAVFEKAAGDIELSGMGCTLTALLVAGEQAVLAHVGDSRLYLLRDGQLHMLSQDHTMAEELHRAGVLPREKVRGHQYAHVLTRVVGNQASLKADILRFEILPQDRLLLCTDGLSDVLHEVEPSWLVETLGRPDLDDIAEPLIARANELGGRDNVTLIVVAIELEKEAAPSARVQKVPAYLTALEQVFLFEGLSLAQRIRVLNATRDCTWEAGTSILTPGDTNPGMYLVLEGALEVEHPDLGTIRLGALDVLGESSLLRDLPVRQATVRAVEDTHGLFLAGDRFRRLTRTRPWLGRRLLLRLAMRLLDVLEHGRRRQAEPDLEALALELI